MEFERQMENDKIDSVDAYISLLKQKGHKRHSMTVITENIGYDKVIDWLRRKAMLNLKKRDPVNVLREYVN